MSQQDRPKLLSLPSKHAPTRLQAKVKEMTDRKRCRDTPVLKCSALNAVLRGWISYYRPCNAKQTATALDFWGNRRVVLGLQKRHRLPPRRVLARYTQRQEGQRDTGGRRNGEDWLFRYRRSDQPLTTYRSRKPAKPSLGEDGATALETPEVPRSASVWLGNAENKEGGRELKAALKAERGAPCEGGGGRMDLDLHHIKARRYGGRDIKANAQLLCEPCQVHTPTSGAHHRLQ